MPVTIWAVLALALTWEVASPANPKDTARLSALASAIRAADYRGERAKLSRLASALDAVKAPQLAAYRSYWQGFAKWRRALNGFNETPMPTDLKDDLETAVSSFREALVHKPDWIEARIGLMGCAGPLLFLAQGDAAWREAILKDYLPVARGVKDQAGDNPRALWLMGQSQLGAPPPYGGDVPKAAAIFHHGIEAALAETRQIAADEPAWIPRWGGAENLMNLAYLYTHSSLKNRDLAIAYTEGALVAAPDWHYVRDVLLVEIRAMGAPSP